MQAYKKIALLQALLLITFLLTGCSRHQGRLVPDLIGDVLPSESTPPSAGRGSSIAKRFQESAPQGQTAVESAIELSQKYATLSEEASVLRRQNQDLIAENRQLKEQATFLDATLKQTQKELTEANDLLIDMRIELNNWKTDVLGFRDEMREAEIAQLEALLKILKILGGEVITESVQAENEASTAAPPQLNQQQSSHLHPRLDLSPTDNWGGEPAQPKSAVRLADKSQETSNQGKQNE